MDFIKPKQIAERVLQGINNAGVFNKLRKAAYISAQRYSIENGNSYYIKTILEGAVERQSEPAINRVSNGATLPNHASRRVNV